MLDLVKTQGLTGNSLGIVVVILARKEKKECQSLYPRAALKHVVCCFCLFFLFFF